MTLDQLFVHQGDLCRWPPKGQHPDPPEHTRQQAPFRYTHISHMPLNMPRARGRSTGPRGQAPVGHRLALPAHTRGGFQRMQIVRLGGAGCYYAKLSKSLNSLNGTSSIQGNLDLKSSSSRQFSTSIHLSPTLTRESFTSLNVRIYMSFRVSLV